jgi:hypothetical protein
MTKRVDSILNVLPPHTHTHNRNKRDPRNSQRYLLSIILITLIGLVISAYVQIHKLYTLNIWFFIKIMNMDRVASTLMFFRNFIFPNNSEYNPKDKDMFWIKIDLGQ